MLPTILEHLGLVTALEVLIEGVVQDTGLNITFASTAPPSPSPEVAAATYEIVREGLAEIARRADARNVRVHLSLGRDGLLCSVKADNGFDADTLTDARQGIGLPAIRRLIAACGGSLTVQPLSEGGMEITATIPLDRAPAAPVTREHEQEIEKS